MTEAHPYDHAFGNFKQLRADVADLRAALLAEQQQRAAEVTELKKEVVSLREIVTRDRHERMSSCHKLATDMTAEVSTRVKALEELRAQHRQNIMQLNEIVQDEMRDRRATDSMRDTRDQATESERLAGNELFQKNLESSKAAFRGVKDEHSRQLNHLNHDIQIVVSYLRKVSASWDGICVSKLMSNRGSRSSPKSPGINGGYDKLGYPTRA